MRTAMPLPSSTLLDLAGRHARGATAATYPQLLHERLFLRRRQALEHAHLLGRDRGLRSNGLRACKTSDNRQEQAE